MLKNTTAVARTTNKSETRAILSARCNCALEGGCGEDLFSGSATGISAGGFDSITSSLRRKRLPYSTSSAALTHAAPYLETRGNGRLKHRCCLRRCLILRMRQPLHRAHVTALAALCGTSNEFLQQGRGHKLAEVTGHESLEAGIF